MAENQEMVAFEAYELIALAVSNGIQAGVRNALEGLENPADLVELVREQDGDAGAELAGRQEETASERLLELDQETLEKVYEQFWAQFTGFDCTLTWHNSTGYKRYPDQVVGLSKGTPQRFAIELHHTVLTRDRPS
jgi:hypothetical protein